MKPNTDSITRPSVKRLVRLLVTIFVPWIAVHKARKQLWLACLVIRNDARAPLREDDTRLRWADEIEHDGWRIWKPYNENASASPNAPDQRPATKTP